MLLLALMLVLGCSMLSAIRSLQHRLLQRLQRQTLAAGVQGASQHMVPAAAAAAPTAFPGGAVSAPGAASLPAGMQQQAVAGTPAAAPAVVEDAAFDEFLRDMLLQDGDELGGILEWDNEFFDLTLA